MSWPETCWGVTASNDISFEFSNSNGQITLRRAVTPFETGDDVIAAFGRFCGLTQGEPVVVGFIGLGDAFHWATQWAENRFDSQSLGEAEGVPLFVGIAVQLSPATLLEE